MIKNLNSVIDSYEVVEVGTLKPYPDNPRVNDLDKIIESLQANKQYRALVVNMHTREVLAGNHTFQAALALGWEHVDVGWIDVDDATAKRIVLVDNSASDNASYDDLLLAAILGELREEDVDLLIGTGYSSDDVDEIIADAVLQMYDVDEDAEDLDQDTIDAVVSMFDRLMPDQEIGIEDEEKRMRENAERAAKLRDEMDKVQPRVYVVFRFGELQAKVPKEAYDVLVASLLTQHDDNLMNAGMAAAAMLGVDADDIEPAIAAGTERWL